MSGYAEENFFERDIPHHKCTEEEYAEFYPVVSSDERLLEVGKNYGLNCIDWDVEDPHLLFGDETNYFGS